MTKKRLAINFCEIDAIVKEVSAAIELGERGFLSKLNSELAVCEKDIREALHQHTNNADILIAQYQKLSDFLNEMTALIQQRLPQLPNSPFKNALDRIQVILIEHANLVKLALERKNAMQQVFLKEIYEFCTLLSGDFIECNQSEDPFIGGYRENNVTKQSGGFCGGLVLSAAFEYLETGKVQYPVVGHRKVQMLQNDVQDAIAKHFINVSEVDYVDTSFNSLLEKLKHNKVYVFLMYGENSAHATILKLYKNGSAHFFDPNFGVFRFRDRIALSQFLSLFFAKLRRINFPSDTLKLFESNKDIANPDLEPTPSLNQFVDNTLAQSHTAAKQQLATLTLDEITTLVLEIADAKCSKKQAQHYIATLIQLFKQQITSYDNPAFREWARPIALYFETADLEHVLQHIALIKEYNPSQVDTDRVVKLIQLVKQFNLLANHPELKEAGKKAGQLVRQHAIKNRTKQTPAGIKLAALLTTVQTYQLQLTHHLTACSQQLTQLDQDAPERLAYEIQFNGIQHLIEKFITHRVKNSIEYLCLTTDAVTDDNLELSRKIAEEILPGITGSLIVSTTIHGETRVPVSAHNVSFYVEQQIANLQSFKRAELARFLARFIVTTKNFISQIKNTASSNNLTEYLVNLFDVFCIEKLEKLVIDLTQKMIGIKKSETAIPSALEALSTVFPVTLQLLSAPDFNGKKQLMDLQDLWVNEYKLPQDDEAAQLTPYFNLLLLQDGAQLKQRIKTMLQSAQAEFALTPAHLQALQAFFDNHVVQLQALLHEYLSHRLKQGDNLSSKILLMNLSETLTFVYAFPGEAIFSPHVKALMKNAVALQNAHSDLEQLLSTLEAEYQKAIPRNPLAILNLPLKKMLDEHYQTRISKVKDLKQSTKMQLVGLLNHERIIEQIAAFIDSNKALHEQLHDMKDHAKATSKLMQQTFSALPGKIEQLDTATSKIKLNPGETLRVSLTTYEKLYLYDRYLLDTLVDALHKLRHAADDERAVLLSLPSCHLSNDPDFLELHQKQKEDLLNHFINQDPSASKYRKQKSHAIAVNLKLVLTELLEQFKNPDRYKLKITLNESATIQTKLNAMLPSLQTQIDLLSSSNAIYSDSNMTQFAEKLRAIVGCTLYSNNGHVYPDLHERISQSLLDQIRQVSLFGQLKQWLFSFSQNESLSYNK